MQTIWRKYWRKQLLKNTQTMILILWKLFIMKNWSCEEVTYAYINLSNHDDLRWPGLIHTLKWLSFPQMFLPAACSFLWHILRKDKTLSKFFDRDYLNNDVIVEVMWELSFREREKNLVIYKTGISQMQDRPPKKQCSNHTVTVLSHCSWLSS